MELSEAIPFLEANRTAIVSTVTSKGTAQATVVNATLIDGRLAFISRGDAVKVKNARRQGRAAVTVIRPTDNRYVTVEGPTDVRAWDNTAPDDLLTQLRAVYTASSRPPERWKDFDTSMREEKRTIVFVSPERVYGSL